MLEADLEQWVREAKAGSRSGLEQTLQTIQEGIYGLSMRMLWHPEDARDATQEILIRVMTHLGDFRGESSFRTWVYRVAVNYLLNVRKSRLERQEYSFERFGRELDENLASPDEPADDAILLEEIKIGCTLGMLLCLDRPHRLAYILGEIMEFDHQEAAIALGITTASFRKRLTGHVPSWLRFSGRSVVYSSRPTHAAADAASHTPSPWAESTALVRCLPPIPRKHVNSRRFWQRFGSWNGTGVPPPYIDLTPRSLRQMTS